MPTILHLSEPSGGDCSLTRAARPADEDEDDSAAAEPVAKTKKVKEQVKEWKVLNDNQVRVVVRWGGPGSGVDLDGTESVLPVLLCIQPPPPALVPCTHCVLLAACPCPRLPRLQALWLRPPGDVSGTEYVKFYRALSKVWGWGCGWAGAGLCGGVWGGC